MRTARRSRTRAVSLAATALGAEETALALLAGHPHTDTVI
ncbi:hypothetical protein GA0115234_106841 [Streptomyces sp. DvalAA-43]|nr:hypothetical protein GA0115234_106841 [Streptomyces sp. DvalAA-43]